MLGLDCSGLQASNANEITRTEQNGHQQQAQTDTVSWGEEEIALATKINELRSTQGLPALEPSSTLSLASRRHALDLDTHHLAAQHEGSDGSLPWGRAKDAGFPGQCVGENVFWITGAPVDADAVLNGWIASSGHYENLVHRDFRYIGLAMTKEHAVAVFGCE